MALRTTAGQVLVNEALPDRYRDYNRVLDGKGLSALLQRVAEEDPDSYRDVAKRLSDVGRDVSYYSGGFSFGLDALKESPVFATARVEMQARIDQILDDDTL